MIIKKHLKLICHYFFFIILIIINFLLLSCKERLIQNPFDPAADPDYWAPEELELKQIALKKIKLIWSQEETNISGFKIDRKVGDLPWKVDYVTLDKNDTSWVDLNVYPDTTKGYYYRLYAYAGENNSRKQEKSLIPSFPAPQNLQLYQLGVAKIMLTWEDESIGEYGFKIDKKVGSGNWITNFTVIDSNITSWTDTLVAQDTLYIYRLYSYVDTINSSSVSGEIKSDFPKPTRLQVQPITDSEINIEWTDNSLFEDGFEIERKKSVSSFQRVAKVKANTTAFVDTGLTYGISYYYRIRAYFHEYFSDYATSGEIKTIFPAPSNLKLEQVNDSRIQLSWSDNCSFELGYDIERKINNESFVKIATLGFNTTTYVDSELKLDTTYTYRIRGFTKNNLSDYEISDSLTLNFPSPTSFKINSISDTEVQLSWDQYPFPNVDGYIIERKTNNNSFVSIVNTPEKSYVDNDISKLNTYSYRVKAYTKDNISDPTQSITIQWGHTYVELWTYEHNAIASDIDLTSDNKIISIAIGQKIVVLDALNKSLIWDKTQVGIVRLIKFSLDDNYLFSIDSAGYTKKWNANNGDLIWERKDQGDIKEAKLSNDNQKIIIGGSDSTFKLLEANTGKVIWSKKTEKTILSADFNSDDTKIVVGSEFDGIFWVKVYETATGDLIWEYDHPLDIPSVKFSNDDSKIVSGGLDGRVTLYDASNGTKLWDYNILGEVSLVCFNKVDAKIFAAGGYENGGKINALNINDGSLIWQGTHSGFVNALDISPDDSKIVTGSVNNEVKVWNTETGELLWIGSHSPYNQGIRCVQVSSDNLQIISGGKDIVRLWQYKKYWKVLE